MKYIYIHIYWYKSNFENVINIIIVYVFVCGFWQKHYGLVSTHHVSNLGTGVV